ncbi:hypothetical protein MMAG44476_01045 [Mycolicibacterium mageritense DSM 44476 = CIP 104973]|uniref:SGNH hydrolase-type esterase domain-containing protein n=1 Tax=Mycolicibacterium mageritense TaxID=53462 RepID=A0ABM7HXW2_MYCME|nr:SGNH/GDSL hydrolase family protein [Mycolicibacterium mageritense]MCC9182826.1 SGNH/GDSL hydrolase family protein [Mycolicibacterium mageritense]BBX35441.1 hypothetical protein MMAGJ_47230 [Mycolicibacterium mageritense]CDO20051.1 GDSL family lipase [Mycolicibacterium mageritense DSM 44476 = CIP 104973]
MTAPRRIAALGSSYAAGPGIPPVADRAAMRSGRNYAHLLAETFGARLTDLTVSGATTSTILDTPQRVALTKFPPQLTGLPSDTDLVLITAAGNDLDYLGSAIKLGVYFTLDRYTGRRLQRWRPATLPVVTQPQLDSATSGLARVVAEAQLRAPQARVVLVDYLPLVGQETRAFEDAPFDAAAIAAVATVHEQLSEVFARAADATRVDLVLASQLGRGHELGTDEPWIQPLQPIHRFAGSFHPNAAGMAAVAQLIERTVA